MAISLGSVGSPMISGSFDRDVDEVVGNIVPLWARVACLLEMSLRLARFTRVHQLTLAEQDKPVEQSDNVGLRLVNSEDHRSIVLLCQSLERFNDIVRVVRVESCQTLVKSSS